MKARKPKDADKTDPSSHTNYAFLCTPEKDERLHQLQQGRRRPSQKLIVRNGRLKRLQIKVEWWQMMNYMKICKVQLRNAPKNKCMNHVQKIHLSGYSGTNNKSHLLCRIKIHDLRITQCTFSKDQHGLREKILITRINKIMKQFYE